MNKLLLILLFTVSCSVSAFTTEQKTSLKTAALAEPSISSCITGGNDVCIADWFNANSTFIVWKTNVTATDVYADTGFDFTLVDGLTAGKRDEWSDFILKFGSFNPSKSNIRAGIVDVWSGTAAKVAVQTAILTLSKRNVTNAEKTLATGTGTTVSPGLLTFEGSITTNDISDILRN